MRGTPLQFEGVLFARHNPRQQPRVSGSPGRGSPAAEEPRWRNLGQKETQQRLARKHRQGAGEHFCGSKRPGRSRSGLRPARCAQSDNIVALSALATGHTRPRMVVVDVQDSITKGAPRIRVSIRDLQPCSKFGNKCRMFHAGAA